MEENLHDNIPEQIPDIFSQGLNPADREQINTWISENTDNKKLLSEFSAIWSAAGIAGKTDEYDENKSLGQI
ncbi:MAG: hypothetical protein HC905_11045 [Bacteroidales bacterium]|nr:hypothetical protein [Bacteroidales bacterium]